MHDVHTSPQYHKKWNVLFSYILSCTYTYYLYLASCNFYNVGPQFGLLAIAKSKSEHTVVQCTSYTTTICWGAGRHNRTIRRVPSHMVNAMSNVICKLSQTCKLCDNDIYLWKESKCCRK